MKKLIQIGLGLAVLFIMTAAYIWFFVYNKPHQDYAKADADFILSAEECYNQFSTGLEIASQYTGKVIQIEGIPSLIETDGSMVIVVFTFNQGMFGDEGIRCTMLPDFQSRARELNIEKKVSIKGYCTGYNGTDVILEQCSLTTN